MEIKTCILWGNKFVKQPLLNS